MASRSKKMIPLAAPPLAAVPMPDTAVPPPAPVSTVPANASPFPGLFVVGDLDDLESLPLEVVMNDRYVGYFNQRIMALLNARHPGRLAFLRFVPDKEQGMVIILPGNSKEEYGAVEIDYTDTEAGAAVNLRRAVQKVNVERVEGRLRVFTVVTRKAPDGAEYLAFVVKESTTRPARKVNRKKKSEAATAATSAPASAQPASDASQASAATKESTPAAPSQEMPGTTTGQSSTSSAPVGPS